MSSLLGTIIACAQTPEQIQQRFPTLTLEQVYAALLYYHKNREKMDAYVADWLEWGRRMRQEQDRNPPPVVVRLRQLRAQRSRAAAAE